MSSSLINIGTTLSGFSTPKVFATDGAYVADKGSAAANGDFYYNSTSNVFRGYINGTWTDVSLAVAAVGSSPNANGISVSNFTITLQPANATNPGVVTTAAQTFAGAKTFSGLLTPSAGIVGTTGGSAATTGNVGERLVATASITNLPTTTQWGDLATLNVAAGGWLLIGQVYFSLNAATQTAAKMGISATSGNSSTGLSEGQTRMDTLAPTTNADTSASVLWFANVSTPTNYYLKFGGTYSAGTPRALGSLQAWRLF